MKTQKQRAQREIAEFGVWPKPNRAAARARKKVFFPTKRAGWSQTGYTRTKVKFHFALTKKVFVTLVFNIRHRHYDSCVWIGDEGVHHVFKAKSRQWAFCLAEKHLMRVLRKELDVLKPAFDAANRAGLVRVGETAGLVRLRRNP